MRMAENPPRIAKNGQIQRVTAFEPPTQDDATLSPDEVGLWLGISGQTVRKKLIRTGQLAAIQVSAKVTRVRAGEVRRYLARQESGVSGDEAAVTSIRPRRR